MQRRKDLRTEPQIIKTCAGLRDGDTLEVEYLNDAITTENMHGTIRSDGRTSK
jgi:hypothetical protein